ncbi:putative 5-hydroxyisourate hydrolase [Lachnellula suecica]|uniref:5-hydroxyisourate hydrolase n=1 Tax=Lachnellula suecica TaxID=602035 RepID=A0A8T9CBH1_9HELO|nr:putative 5-hydroxyisourate hydrolase [Lachnellula suecica]
MATPSKDAITCHALDTTTGRPAADIAVKLVCTSVPDIVFSCKTNADGRIMLWQNTQGPDGGEGSFVKSHRGVPATLHWMIKHHAERTGTAACPVGSSVWKLEFDTGAYYGAGNTFFPKVELTFLVKEGEHFHVPLLLGPYSFTTYRGS